MFGEQNFSPKRKTNWALQITQMTLLKFGKTESKCVYNLKLALTGSFVAGIVKSEAWFFFAKLAKISSNELLVFFYNSYQLNTHEITRINIYFFGILSELKIVKSFAMRQDLVCCVEVGISIIWKGKIKRPRTETCTTPNVKSLILVWFFGEWKKWHLIFICDCISVETISLKPYLSNFLYNRCDW